MLKVQTRQTKTNPSRLRKSGSIPAVIYGYGEKTRHISVKESDYIKEIKKYGESSLIDCQIDDEEAFKVLLQDYQIDPIKQKYIHIDFYKINMDKKLKTEIPLAFVGESEAVKNGGVLVKNKTEINVECFPAHLISEIVVDLSVLKNIHDSIKLATLPISEGIEYIGDPEEIVATVTEPSQEEEVVSKEVEDAAIEELAKEKEKEKEEEKEKADEK